MPILKDIEISLDPEKIALDLNRGRENRNVVQGLEKAAARALELVTPRALYERVEVLGRDGEVVRVAKATGGPEAALKIGPKADLLDPAEQAVITVVTIGPDLEEEVLALNKSGHMLESYFLDSAGVVALGEVGGAVRTLVEEMAREQDLGVGASLAPGSLVGWPVSGQRELLSLLDLSPIGVVLNPSCLLQPFKSASGFIGLGRAYSSQRVGSVCKYCSLSATCWRRRRDAA